MGILNTIEETIISEKTLALKECDHFLHTTGVLSVENRTQLINFLHDIVSDISVEPSHPSDIRTRVDPYHVRIVNGIYVCITDLSTDLRSGEDTARFYKLGPAYDRGYDGIHPYYYGGAAGLLRYGYSSVLDGIIGYSKGIIRTESEVTEQEKVDYDALLRTLAKNI